MAVKKPVSLMVIAVALLLLAGGRAFAEKEKEKEALPDDILYQVKRVTEDTKLATTIDPIEKAALHTKYAGKRLIELKQVVAQSKLDLIKGLTEDYEKSINGAMEEINRAQKQGKNVEKALNSIEKITGKHIAILTSLLPKIPKLSKKLITHAAEVASQNRKKAIAELAKIQAKK